jgi:hypothetical protein
MHRPWVEMVARGVHGSFEGGTYRIGYIFEKWNYTREQKIKCRDDLAWYMTERDHPDTDIYWTVSGNVITDQQIPEGLRASIRF